QSTFDNFDASNLKDSKCTQFYWKDDPYISGILGKNTFRYRELDLLGHYTKMETAIEHILPLKKLLINKLCLSNDPVESKKSVSEFIKTNSSKWEEFIENNHEENSLYKFYQNSVRYISFTKNKGTRKVYEAPAMWAHYGQKHKGVCLVFDKKLLKKLIKRQFPPSNLKGLSVSYNLHCSELKQIEKNEHERHAEFFLRNAKDVLFKKNRDWREESEYRYVVISNDSSNNGNGLCFLENINQALIAVVLGIEFNENYKCAIINLLKGSHIRVYQLYFKNGKFVLSLVNTDELIGSPEDILQYCLIDEL
ncbi:MAG TPA: hypothetical protein DD458_02890, partial [Prolixibacteraceae bacterium]|nr:hypothetical protein [Prolixibacteraceae bacterium]HCR91605.1 hypothetical protein [Prolixibacteraceae bacterium]